MSFILHYFIQKNTFFFPIWSIWGWRGSQSSDIMKSVYTWGRDSDCIPTEFKYLRVKAGSSESRSQSAYVLRLVFSSSRNSSKIWPLRKFVELKT